MSSLSCQKLCSLGITSVLFLGWLNLLPYTQGHNVSYCVKPTDSELGQKRSENPSDSLCETLEYYQGNQHIFKNHSSEYITIAFLQGVHKVKMYKFTSSKLSKPLQFVRQNGLHLLGLGPAQNVTILGLTSMFATTKSVSISNITFKDCYLNAYKSVSAHDPDAEINITNCTFIFSKIIFSNVNLFVKDTIFKRCQTTALTVYSSIVMLLGNVFFRKNSGRKGGALALKGSTLMIESDANIVFKNNSASETGGAIHVDNADLQIMAKGDKPFCFYILDGSDPESNYSLRFVNNTAAMGGDHIYGASLKSYCISLYCTCFSSYITLNRTFQFIPDFTAMSAVSGYPSRVCTCDKKGQPQCANLSYIFVGNVMVHPGEMFAIRAVVVGGDFGATTGTVYAKFITTSNSSLRSNQTEQLILQNKECSLLQYSIFSYKKHEVISLTTEMEVDYDSNGTEIVERLIANYTNSGVIDNTLLQVPIIISVTLLSCPLGFSLSEEFSACDCHPSLTAFFYSNSYHLDCHITDGIGYMSWNDLVWMGAPGNESSTFLVALNCPTEYCKLQQHVDLQTPDMQCTLNRAGILCGRCKNGYSLAIGSSHCIYCSNNNNLAILILLAAAGPLLVVLISTLNLTVTQGMVNGLIFYANIVWAYERILFPSDRWYVLRFFKPFIAWLNLDFGIETCFFKGLDAFTKTWLQFVFPLYTASLFFVGLKFSLRLSKLFGSRSVPTLATLLFLTYTKLLRTIIAGLQLSSLVIFHHQDGRGSTKVVWALDGNLTYGHYPHIFLLLACLGCLVLMWIPYTLLIFSMQWLRKIDHYKPLKIIATYKPVYDAYFAPLRDKQHYWFGVLLLAQGVILIVSSLTMNIIPSLNLFLLLAIASLLLCYMNHVKTYKKLSVSLVESSFLLNLIALSAGTLHFRGYSNQYGQTILLSSSIMTAIIEFCGIVIWNLIPQIIKLYQKKVTKSSENHDMIRIVDQEPAAEDEQYLRYRDSVLDIATVT